MPFNVNDLQSRHGVDQRAQDVRAEGRRRALRPAAQPARAARAASSTAAATSAACGPARSTSPASSASARPRSCASRRWRPTRQRLQRLRDRLNDEAARRARRDLHQRVDGASAAAQPEHQLRLRRGRVAADGHQRRRGVVRARRARRPASSRPTCSKALGAGDDLAHSSIRFGLGRWTTEEEVDYVADKLTIGRDAAARDVAALRARKEGVGSCPRCSGRNGRADTH